MSYEYPKLNISKLNLRFHHEIFFPANDPTLGNYIIGCSGQESGSEARFFFAFSNHFPISIRLCSFLSPFYPHPSFFFFFFLIYLLLSPLSYSSLSYHYLSSVTTPGLSSTHTAARMIFLKAHVIRPMPLTLMDPVAAPSPIPASLWHHPGLLSSTSLCLGQLAFLQFSECIMSFVHSS